MFWICGSRRRGSSTRPSTIARALAEIVSLAVPQAPGCVMKLVLAQEVDEAGAGFQLTGHRLELSMSGPVWLTIFDMCL